MLLWGTFLPLVTDKVRNNVRSRAHLIAIYTLIAAIVSVIVVLVITPVDSVEWTGVFASPPPTTFTIGVPLEPFSFQVKNDINLGVQDLTVGVVFIPIEEFDLEVALQSASMISRSINCLKSLVILDSTYTMEDLYFCAFNQCNAVTDDTGMAVFENCTIEFGPDSTYIAIASVDKRPELIDFAYAAGSLDVASVTLGNGFNTGTMAIGSSFSFSITAEIVSSQPPSRLGAYLVTLNLGGDSAPIWVPFSANDDLQFKTGLFVPSYVNTTTFVLKDSESSVYQCSFTFSSASLKSSSSAYLYFGVVVGGTFILPLSSRAWSAVGQVPPQLIYPFLITTAVSTVTVVPSGSLGATATVVEGSPLLMSITVNDASGSPLAGRVVYIMAAASAANPSSNTTAMEHPLQNPKSVWFNVIVATDSGTVSVSKTFFSSSGAVGYYDLYVMVDGVTGTWPGGSKKLTVLVTTSMAMYDISDPGAAEVVTVGKRWNTLPSVTIMNVNGTAIPGKYVELRSVDSNADAVLAYSSPSGDDGVSPFSAIVVGFANPNSPQPHQFAVVVDGVVVGYISRQVTWTPESYYNGDCSFVRIDSFPLSTASGTLANVYMTALDAVGNPASASKVTFFNDAQGAFVYESAVTTDSNGQIYQSYLATSTGVSNKFLQIQCATETPTFVASSAVVVFRARVDSPSASFSITPNTGTATLQVNFNADWAEVDSSKPIRVGAALVWFPTYAQLYSASSLPSCSTVQVTQQSDVPVTLSCSDGFDPGYYVFVPIVDRITVLPALEVTIPAIVASLVIVQSAFDSSAAANSAPFATFQPTIQVLDTSRNGIQGAIVYILLLSRLHGSSSPFQAQAILDNPQTLTYGSILIDGVTSVSLPVSSPSDSQGNAVFSGVVLAAAAQKRDLSVRYCVVNNAAGAVDVCVDETAFYSPSLDDKVELTSSVTEAVGTPGARLSNIITITAVYGVPVQPLRALLCTAFATAPNSSTELTSFLRFYEADLTQAQFPVKLSNTNSLTLILGIAPTVKPSQYQLHLACSGAVLTIPIGITSQAVSVNFARQPPARVRVDSTFSFLATVQSTGPLSGSYLEVSFSRKNDTCTYNGCGIFSDSSTVVSQTNKRGEASFFLGFQAADNGAFELTVKVRLGLSPSSARAGIISAVTDISGIFGLTRTALLNTLDPLSDVYTNLKLVYSVISSGSHDSGEKVNSNAKQMFLNFIGQVDPSVTSTVSVEVHNPVREIQIIRQGSYDMKLASVQIKGLAVPPTKKVVSPSDAALLLLLDENGAPVVNESVEVNVLPLDGSSPLTILYPYSLQSNGSGYCLVHPLTLSTSTPGKYTLIYSSNGGATVPSAPVNVQSSPPLQLSEAMKYASFIVLGFFSPMLLSTVPHSRPWYLAMALIANVIALSAIFGAGVSYGPDFFLKNDFVRGYFVFVYILTVVVLCMTGVVVFGYIAGYKFGISKFQFLNDEARALRLFKYTRWIVNVRIAKQTPKPKSIPLVKRIVSKVKDMFAGKKKESETQQATLKEPMIAGKDNKQLKKPEERETVFDAQDPKLQYDPQLDPTNIPMDYWIVLGISTILVIIISLVTVYIYQYIAGQLSILLSFFPQIKDSVQAVNAGASAISGSSIDQYLAALLSQLMQMLAQKFPKYAGLATAAVTVQNIDLLGYLTTIETALQEIALRFTPSFWVAFTVALVAIVLNAVFTLLAIKDISAAIRRQALEVPFPIANSQAYIGIHCLHFVLMQQIAFWIIFIICLALSISFIRIFVWTKIQAVIYAMIGLALLLKILQVILVKKILTFGTFTIIRPEMYALWDFFAIIIGVFEGIRISITRFVTAVVVIIILFAKLDVSLYPAMLQNKDKGHSNFIAIINTETKNNNPIYLCMCTILLLARELRRNKAAGQTKVSVTSLFEGERNLSAAIINLARIYGRFLCGSRTDDELGLHMPATTKDLIDLELIDDKRARRWNIICLRFRLMLLLHRHPQLRRYRKRFLYGEADAPLGTTNSVVVDVTPHPPIQQYRQSGARGADDSFDLSLVDRGHHQQSPAGLQDQHLQEMKVVEKQKRQPDEADFL